MSNRQKNGIACLFIAVLLLGVAVNNTFNGPQAADGVSQPVGRIVGVFLPSVVVAAIGFWLLQKPKAL